MFIDDLPVHVACIDARSGLKMVGETTGSNIGGLAERTSYLRSAVQVRIAVLRLYQQYLDASFEVEHTWL